MKKKILCLALAMILCLGLVPSTLAVGQTFSDVPSTHWGYADIEAAAEAGLMNGTGNGEFSPNLKVSVAQFLTLLGRLVFPEITVGANDTWYGPYVAAAQTNGLLTGTQVDVTQSEAEISRYDMAVILRAAAKKLGVTEKSAQSSEVTDYGMVPAMYADAVLAVYGMGLIHGDQNGNFNGSNTMMRTEVATVIMRLVRSKPGSGGQGNTTDPAKPTETPPPVTDPSQPPVEMKMMKLTGWMQYDTKGNPKENGTGVENVPFQLRYTEDYGATYTVIAEGITGQGSWYGTGMQGSFELTTQVEKPIYDKSWDGNGQLYISAETTVNGQKYVTQDRRTDGKATIIPIGRDWSAFYVNLVPADHGETVDVPICGRVEAITYVEPANGSGQMKFYNSGTTAGSSKLTNSTVKIYFDPLQEGVAPVLIWETTADGGSFNETMTIDTAYYRTTGKHYILEAEAVLDGQLCTCLTKISVSLTKLMGRGSGEELGTVWWTITSDEYWEFGLRTPRFE